MRDFWISCGHHLLDRAPGGGLAVTDEFLKAYFIRPELTPPPDACALERKLHGALLAEPRRPIDSADISAIADADAQENWRFVLAFRELLLRHPTLEAAYLALMRGAAVTLPPLFVNQLAHVILRNALDGCDDPFVLRAGELFFRPQRIMPNQQSIMAADEEWIASAHPESVAPLLSLLDMAADAKIEEMDDANAASYWRRSDMFDLGLDLSAAGRGRAALAEAMTRWIRHLLAVDVRIEPLAELRDARFTWYVGLDAEATKIGDRLWNDGVLDDGMSGRVVALFQLVFPDHAAIIDGRVNEPVYLILAASPDRILRMKPQNLVTGLPVRHLEAAS